MTPGRVVVRGTAVLLLCAACLGAVQQFRPWMSLSVTRDSRTWYPHAQPSRAAPGAVLRGPEPAPAPAPAPMKIFVWGDSHARAYSSLLQELKERTGAQVVSFARGGCPVAALQAPTRQSCKAWVQDTAARINRLAIPGDVVFLASLRVDRLSDQWATFAHVAVAPGRADGSRSVEQIEALREADALVTALEQAGLQVVIDAPKPVFRAPPFRCADWFNARNPIYAGGFDVDRAFLQAHRMPTMDALAALQDAHPRLVVCDPYPVLCPCAACSAFDGHRPLYFDGDHLSGHGNRALYPSFLAIVTSLAQRPPAASVR